MSQTFEEAQISAASYAARERKFGRYAYFYLAFAVVSAFVSALISVKLLLPSLILSAVTYTAARYGKALWTWGNHKWLNWKALRESPSANISMQSLLPAMNIHSLRELANGEMTHAGTVKNEKIKHYEKKVSFTEAEPLSYYDYKHTRALFQYSMIQATKKSALNGQGEFFTFMEEEKAQRRQIKLNILALLKNEYIDTHKLSISIKYTEGSPTGKCTLGGTEDDKAGFITKVKALNKGPRLSLLTLPANPDQENEAIMQTLLPLVLDLDAIVKAIPIAQREQSRQQVGRRIIYTENTYPITSEALWARIKKLSKNADVELQANDDVDSEKSFELRV